jgi:hypothetical protein
MSLKIVHVVFIIAAGGLAALLSAWATVRYGVTPGGGLLALAVGSLAALIGLTVYLRAFLARCRREGWT